MRLNQYGKSVGLKTKKKEIKDAKMLHTAKGNYRVR